MRTCAIAAIFVGLTTSIAAAQIPNFNVTVSAGASITVSSGPAPYIIKVDGDSSTPSVFDALSNPASPVTVKISGTSTIGGGAPAHALPRIIVRANIPGNLRKTGSTVDGSMIDDGRAVLRVLVAGDAAGWPTSGSSIVAIGATTFDGIEFQITDASGAHAAPDTSWDSTTNADARVRAVSSLVVSISSHLTDTILCGQLFKLDTGNGGQASGADIEATFQDDRFEPQYVSEVTSNPNPHSIYAIDYVFVNTGINARVEAKMPSVLKQGGGDFYPRTRANNDRLMSSIRTVLVGTTPSSIVTGINGDIVANDGAIRSIFSNGPISGNITGKQGIDEVRTPTVDASGNPIGIAANISTGAAVGTGTAFVPYPTVTSGAPDDPLNHYWRYGALRLVECGGTISGFIDVAHISGEGPGGTYQPGTTSGLCGIITPGPMAAAVNVRYLMREANIIGSSVTGTVTIGKQLKGAIVAYGRADTEGPGTAVNDPSAGEIWTLSVGDGVDDFNGSDPYWVDDGTGSWFGFRTGFVGSALSPIPMNPGSGGPSSPTAAWEHRVWLTTSARIAGGVTYAGLDSVIRAELLIRKGCVIRRMTQTGYVQRVTKDDYVDVVNNRPRLESPVILATSRLKLGHNEEGVVWSGALDHVSSSGSYVLRDDPSNNYVDCPIFEVLDSVVNPLDSTDIRLRGSVGPAWDAFIDLSLPQSGALFTIAHEMCGELHFPQIENERSVVIGGLIGLPTDFQGTALSRASTEASPRGMCKLTAYNSGGTEVNTFEAQTADKGTVYIDQRDPLTGANKLNGQVVVMAVDGVPASGTPANFLRGRVKLGEAFQFPSGTSAPSFTVLENTAAQPDTIPFYDRLSDTLGDDNTAAFVDGGAVGLAPFRLHSEDCQPENRQVWTIASPPLFPTVSVFDYPTFKSSAWSTLSADIRSRFYGPAVLRNTDPLTNEQGVTIEFSVDDTFSAPTDATPLFQVEVSTEVPVQALSRDLVYRARCGETIPFGFYRVVRNVDSPFGTSRFSKLLGGLTTDTTTGDHIENAAFAHYFRFVCSLADIGVAGGFEGSDGLLDNNDFIVFINLFFAQDPRADLGIAGGLAGSDNLWDNNDFIAFIDLFFNDAANCTGAYTADPCDPPPGGGERPGPGGGPGEGMSAGTPQTPEGFLTGFREALEAMIANEPDAARRAQLQEMLNAITSPR